MVRDYSKISIRSFMQFPESLPCDIFVQLGAEKFTRIFTAGDRPDLKRFASYQKRGVNELFIRRQDAKSYILNLQAKLEDPKKKEEELLDIVDEILPHSLNLVLEQRRLDPEVFSAMSASVDITIRLFEDNVLGVAKLLERVKKRSRLFRHLISTSVFSIILTKTCGGSEWDLKVAGLAGLFHDLGLNEFPDTYDEHSSNEEIARHENLQSHASFFDTEVNSGGLLPDIVLLAIRDHHEYFDGSGYPNGKKGQEICYEARILAVAETFSSLTTGTKLRGPISPTNAIAQIQRDPRFDPDVMRKFCALFIVNKRAEGF